jgi:ribosomal protein S18 acetylase RimI-like enzyme
LTEVTVRLLSPHDAEALVALRREALQHDPLAFAASPSDDRASSLSFVRESLSETASAVTLGAFQPELVGAVRLSREGSEKQRHKAFVWGLYVQPASRRRGLARGLMLAAIRHARGWPGVLQVHLSVSDASREASSLYSSLGFVSWGSEPRALQVAERFLAEQHMVLMLA